MEIYLLYMLGGFIVGYLFAVHLYVFSNVVDDDEDE